MLVIKAMILVYRAGRFVREWKNRHVREGDDLIGISLPEFKSLTNVIACFQISLPTHVQPCRLDEAGRLDIDLIMVKLLPHLATIVLFEPFADLTDPRDSPSARILSACQSIVATVQQLVGLTPNEPTQTFPAIMHPSTN